MANPLSRFLVTQGFVVLDGGLATALEARGEVLDSGLWSAKLLVDAPESIRAVHAEYLEAGADVISTASYQATLPGFARMGVGAAEGEKLLRRSVDLAMQARDAFWSVEASRERRIEPLVAASVGPYGAYLADGSEYDGRYGAVGASALAEFHRSRLAILADTRADLLAIETIPSLVEVRAVVGVLGEFAHPDAWISFSCRDGSRLWDGTAVEDAARACLPEAGIVAVGVNCTAPQHVTRLVERMRGASDLAILAYPNSGERYDASTGRWSGSPAGPEWLERVSEWVDAGARMVGGCCRVGPDTIRGIRRRMEEVR